MGTRKILTSRKVVDNTKAKRLLLASGVLGWIIRPRLRAAGFPGTAKQVQRWLARAPDSPGPELCRSHTTNDHPRRRDATVRIVPIVRKFAKAQQEQRVDFTGMRTVR